MPSPIAIAILNATREALGQAWHSLTPRDRAAIEAAAHIAAEAGLIRASGQPLPKRLETQLAAHAANLASISAGTARSALFAAANSLFTSAARLFPVP